MTLLFTVLIFISAIALMSIGVMLSRKPIKSGCGGLSKLDNDCDCKTIVTFDHQNKPRK